MQLYALRLFERCGSMLQEGSNNLGRRGNFGRLWIRTDSGVGVFRFIWSVPWGKAFTRTFYQNWDFSLKQKGVCLEQKANFSKTFSHFEIWHCLSVATHWEWLQGVHWSPVSQEPAGRAKGLFLMWRFIWKLFERQISWSKGIKHLPR